jgi:hypothetical protein
VADALRVFQAPESIACNPWPRAVVIPPMQRLRLF